MSVPITALSAPPLPRAGRPRPLRIRTRAGALGVTVLALLGAVLVSPGQAQAAAPTPAGRFVPIGPIRVLDTADSNRPFGPNEARTVDLSKAFTAPAGAVVLNLTAAGGTGNSFQTVYPTGTARPTASNLNEPPGSIRANSVTVGVGQGGANQNKVDIYNLSGSVRLVVDVTGYYTLAGSSVAGLGYVPLQAPVRLFDSRQKPGPLTTSQPGFTAHVDYGSAALNKVIHAVLVNFTATDVVGSGYLTVWDGAGPQPNASSLNFASGQTVANLAIAPVRCTDASCLTLTFAIAAGAATSVQVVGDLQGAYVDPGQAGSLVYQSTDRIVRLLDSRTGTPWAALGSGASNTVGAAWGSTVQAVVLNVTAVQPTGSTYLTVWGTGADRPGTSSLNAPPGDIVANAVQTRVGANGGGFQVFNFSGTTNVLADFSGAFVPDPTLG